jgi:uncharacterized protein with NRDE domain
MCTVSWVHQEDGYQLFSNRDEKHTRKPALAPRLRERRQVQFLAPIDGDQGGSWIGVNQFGLSLCLLNLYQEEGQFTDSTMNYTSRGLLLIDLIDCPSRADTRTRVEGMDLRHYRPFTLAALEPGRPALLIHWTGRRRLSVNDGEPEMPLLSSSYDSSGVFSSRRQIFNSLLAASGRVSAEMLDLFHASHFPSASAYSPCMHRADASTVSFSRVRVSRDKIEFLYRPGSPCNVDNQAIHLEIRMAEKII